MKCAVTGANGYLGSKLIAYLESKNVQVIPLGRHSSAGIYFSLENPSPNLSDEFRRLNVDALVHCAYDFRATRWEEIYKNNVEGTEKLFQAARSGGVSRMVYISSISAFEGCRSLYGKAKLEAESVVRKEHAWIIRPALIYGRSLNGLLGKMVAVAQKLPVLPIFGATSPIYLTFDEDLCKLIHSTLFVAGPPPVEPILVAHPKKWTFLEVLRYFAQHAGKQPRFLRLPWIPVWLALKSLECLGVKLGFRSDSVLGLVFQNPKPDLDILQKSPIAMRFSSPQEIFGKRESI